MAKKKRMGKSSVKKAFSHVKKAHKHAKNAVKKLVRIDHTIPTGIKVLILFSSIMGLIYLVLASMFSFTFLFGIVLEGTSARLFNIIMILAVAFMIFGFYKKNKAAYILANTVFITIIANTLISMFFIRKSVTGTLSVFVAFSFFFIMVMNVITLWYVRHQKKYFLYHYHPKKLTADDRAFIYGLSTLWIVFLFVSSILGNAYYNETIQKVDVLYEELYWSYSYEAKDLCLDKGEDRDLCLLTAAILYAEEVNSVQFCKEIDSMFYKYSCLKAIQGDIV